MGGSVPWVGGGSGRGGHSGYFGVTPPPQQALLALLDAALAKVSGDGSAPQRHLRVTALLSAAESIVRAAALRMRGHSGDDVFISAGGTGMGSRGAAGP